MSVSEYVPVVPTIELQDRPLVVLQVGSGRKRTLEQMGMYLKHQDGSPFTGGIQLINLDMLAHTNPDIVCELGVNRIDLDDESVDAVIAMHILEHIGRQGELAPWLFAWEELYRVLRPGGVVRFECPYHSSVWAWADPTHTRAISEYTFLYLNQDAYRSPGSAIPDYRPRCDFELVACELIPDHTNADVRERERISFIRGTLQARKPFRPYWED